MTRSEKLSGRDEELMKEFGEDALVGAYVKLSGSAMRFIARFWRC